MTKSREVADYLKKNPNFFTENRDLLAGLELPEQPELPGLPGTAPVHERIHERQVRALRTRHDLQQAKLDLMVDTVKNNQALEQGVHQFAVTLLNLEDLDPANPDAPALLVKSRFDVDNVAVFLSSRQQDFSPEVDYSLLCRRVEHLGSVCDDRISSKLGSGVVSAGRRDRILRLYPGRPPPKAIRRDGAGCRRQAALPARHGGLDSRPPGRIDRRIPGGARSDLNSDMNPRYEPRHELDKHDMNAEQADSLREFLAHLRQRRLSPHTVDAYRRDLDRLAAFLENCEGENSDPENSGSENSASKNWCDLSAKQARAFPAKLHQSGLSGRSIQRMLAAARALYRHLLATGRATVNPFDGVSAPKSGHKLPATLSVDELSALLGKHDGSVLSIRDHAMLELFYSSGLRLAELASLDYNGIDFEQSEVRVTGKGNRQRIVPVGRKAAAALTEWLNHRDTLANSGETALFVNKKRPPPRRPRNPAPAQSLGQKTRPGPPPASAHATPFIRQPRTRLQRRPARGSGNARTCRHRHYADLYPS